MKIIISITLALFLVACSEESGTVSSQKEISKEVSKVTENESVVQTQELKELPENNLTTQDQTVTLTLEESTQVISSKSGAELFKVCSSCHGMKGEKKALNKSQIIQGWSEMEVAKALNGYRDGSYGGAMKGLMKSQIAKLSDEEIAILSKYISEL